MGKTSDEGIPLEEYLKTNAEPFVRVTLDRDELRYTWTDADNRPHASDDGGPKPPKGWWVTGTTTIDREQRLVQGNALFGPTFPMYFVKVYPAVVPAAERPAQKAPRRGRKSSVALVLEEAAQQLQGPDRARYERQGRENFLAGLSDWLRDTHPEAPQMTAKTIGDRLRGNDKVRDLLPKSWVRKK